MERLPFMNREKQVIGVPARLSPGDSLLLELSYKGQIDERICYLNVPDAEIADTRERMYLACRFGETLFVFTKRFYFVDPGGFVVPDDCSSGKSGFPV